VKEFATYTLLRLVYLVVTYVIVLGVWMLVTDREGLIQLEPLVIAFLVSGIASYLLLDRQREAFAQRVDARARRASDNFSKMKAREDED